MGDSCAADADCSGDRKCCHNGCQRVCMTVGRGARIFKTKLGRCPKPAQAYGLKCNKMGDRCAFDGDCPGQYKCCFNGCQKDCIMPKRRPGGRPKPGVCPMNDWIDPKYCENTKDECSNDYDCYGRRKCCHLGCRSECLEVPGSKPKPGLCPVPSFVNPEYCVDTRNKCDFDAQCSGTMKCCFTGCSKECVESPETPRVPKPGKCPKPWKGKDGLCDRRGDMCQRDQDCLGSSKCCFNGCQKDCLKPFGLVPLGKKKPGQCPPEWKGG